jgi:transposase
MTKQNKHPDFSDIKLFIGIDTHSNSWKVTIRTNDIVLKTFSMNPSPEELSKHLNKNYPNAIYYSVYEAGFCGFWIHRELLKFGINNIVINPADVPVKQKEKQHKQDKIDSQKLARELANGSLDPIFVPNKEQESLKAVSRRREQIRKRSTQIKNRIKQFLHNRGIDIPHRSEVSHWSGRFIHWLKNIPFEQSNNKYYLDSLLVDFENERKQMLHILKHIRHLVKDNEIIKYLKSIPGIGLITAFTFYAEISDIIRFATLDKLLAFLGLIPDTSSTGDHERVKGITKRRQKHLRYLIIEAAWVAARKDPALTLAFSNLMKKNIPNKKLLSKSLKN